jgi:hypothetical protein
VLATDYPDEAFHTEVEVFLSCSLDDKGIHLRVSGYERLLNVEEDENVSGYERRYPGTEEEYY